MDITGTQTLPKTRLDSKVSNLAPPSSENTHSSKQTEKYTRTDVAPLSDKVTISVEAKAKQATELELSEEEIKEVEELKQRDREVRQHEAAHLAAAGAHATGGATFTYKTGPDGVRYAVGGEVGVDTSPVAGDPQATLEKARKLRAAAMAPAEPSSADRAIAAAAAKMANEAQIDLAKEQQEKDASISASAKSNQPTVNSDKSISRQENESSNPYSQTYAEIQNQSGRSEHHANIDLFA